MSDKSSYSHLSILLAEDSVVQRQHALDLLKQLGITNLRSANNGNQALALLTAEQGRANILITDLDMPFMDGVDLIRHIAQKNVVDAIIVVSSHDSNLLTTVETMAQEHGLIVLGVVEKPLSQATLSALLDLYAKQPQLQAQLQQNDTPQQYHADEIGSAINQRQMILHYQPKVTTHSGVIRGVEALVRWQHPQHGLVTPKGFLPVIENHQAIHTLTNWVLETALKQLRDWHSRGLTISVAVNLSAKSLSVPDLAEHIGDLSSRIGIEPKYLLLEITESAAASDLPVNLGTLVQLRLKGFGLAIDDFGTGFSSMQQLSRVPFTELKVDGSLVHRASQKPSLHTMLQSTIELGKKLRLTTVAEGVEEADDWQLIRLLGCDVGQGFFVAKPMPGEQLVGWLKQEGQLFRNDHGIH